MSELTAKQEAFCEEYLIDLNATQAAIRAGYSERSAAEIGYENLTKPQILERVAQLKAERSERTTITADKVLRELAIIAFSDISEFDIDIDDKKVSTRDGAPPEAIRSVGKLRIKKKAYVDRQGNEETEVETDIGLWSKPDALKMLMRHLGIEGAKEIDHGLGAGSKFNIDNARDELAKVLVKKAKAKKKVKKK